MTEKEMREYVDCGLVKEDEYELLKSIMQHIDYDDKQARRFAYWTFCYHTGDITCEEYQNAEIYKDAKKNGWI